ncbi:hypothetical protein CPLU01_03342 [Colletotrichum plurivorum]|uniref:Uncharacterized protein n=1 Tax=Colletotrichum plurivorum TaxID=2175906 RepID=A0A8H6KTQ8_9PEZI|nr:hypothetical protein CPLU01_03342 [Colletotrichum plurivorum]
MQGTARGFWLLDCGGRRCRALGGAPEHVSLQLTGRPVPLSTSRDVGRLKVDRTQNTTNGAKARAWRYDAERRGTERLSSSPSKLFPRRPKQREGAGWELSSDPLDRTGGPTCQLDMHETRAGKGTPAESMGPVGFRAHSVPPWRSRVCPAAVVSVVSASTGPRSRITEPVLAGNFQSLHLPNHSAELYLEAEYANAGLLVDGGTAFVAVSEVFLRDTLLFQQAHLPARAVFTPGDGGGPRRPSFSTPAVVKITPAYKLPDLAVSSFFVIACRIPRRLSAQEREASSSCPLVVVHCPRRARSSSDTCHSSGASPRGRVSRAWPSTYETMHAMSLQMATSHLVRYAGRCQKQAAGLKPGGGSNGALRPAGWRDNKTTALAFVLPGATDNVSMAYLPTQFLSAKLQWEANMSLLLDTKGFLGVFHPPTPLVRRRPKFGHRSRVGMLVVQVKLVRANSALDEKAELRSASPTPDAA